MFIMVVGTSSDSGKSTIALGLCRYLSNLGYKVAPFKSQNMSLNSRVTKEDGEIAVAQYIQSLAARTEPSVHFNPILLKPKGNFKSQVILHGKPYKDMDYNEYRKNKDYFLKKIKESLEILKENYDFVVMEGAGSCCEINLLKDDIANLRIAELVNAKSILVADIDRGGVFASIYGTIKLLPEKWRKLIKGIVINKFRGNIDVLKDGIDMIEELTGIPVLGVVPYCEDLNIPSEDSQALQKLKSFGNKKSKINVNVVKFNKISNFWDIEVLKYDSYIKLLNFDEDIDGDILILPGTRTAVNESYFLKEYNWDEKINEFLKDGGIVVGICGGYQVLGERLINEKLTDGDYKYLDGLKILKTKTVFGNKKIIKNSIGIYNNNNLIIKGYELHEGYTYSKERPFLKVERGFGNCGDGFDGAIKENKGLVIGTYFHGIFENFEFRKYLLDKVCERKGLDKISEDKYNKQLEESFNKAANILKDNLNLDILIG